MTAWLVETALLAVLGSVPVAVAHGGDLAKGTNMTMTEYPPTYFAHPDHKGLLYAHIGLMVAAWVFMLPVSVMLSLAHSRHVLPSQLAFLVINGVGVLPSFIYNARTPDLYPNNAHHKLGWIVTVVVGAQVIIGFLSRMAAAPRLEGRVDEYASFIPVSAQAVAEHDTCFLKPSRLSRDSGQGTERHSESLNSQSSASCSSGTTSPTTCSFPLHHVPKEEVEDHAHDDDLEARPVRGRYRAASSLVRKAAGKVSSRIWKPLLFVYDFVDRTIIILGFITLCTGIATLGRFFEGHGIFTGLAHWIKGGVFVLFGIFTLGRWAGSFGDWGWAWNLRPKAANNAWRPSAEFVESALIFTYGATNIFLEHLGNAGGEFSTQDLEHIAITVLFLGGGLCGMLIEATWIRQLLNITVAEAAQVMSSQPQEDDEREALGEPEAYAISLNPLPALVILLLGIMMSSHTQEDMTSAMVHKQWGQMLTGASFARALTYVLMYLKPPRSIFPSRPPTELLTAFGLIAGGAIFMASSGDTVNAMNHYGLDAMFIFTVTTGFVGLLMAWVVLVIAVKGWATRKEAHSPAGLLSRDRITGAARPS